MYAVCFCTCVFINFMNCVVESNVDKLRMIFNNPPPSPLINNPRLNKKTYYTKSNNEMIEKQINFWMKFIELKLL